MWNVADGVRQPIVQKPAGTALHAGCRLHWHSRNAGRGICLHFTVELSRRIPPSRTRDAPSRPQTHGDGLGLSARTSIPRPSLRAFFRASSSAVSSTQCCSHWRLQHPHRPLNRHIPHASAPHTTSTPQTTPQTASHESPTTTPRATPQTPCPVCERPEHARCRQAPTASAQCGGRQSRPPPAPDAQDRHQGAAKSSASRQTSAFLHPCACTRHRLRHPRGLLYDDAGKWARHQQCSSRGIATDPRQQRWFHPEREPKARQDKRRRGLQPHRFGRYVQ